MEIQNLESPVLITVDEVNKEVVATITPFTKDLDLGSMQKAVGGYIEILKSRCGKYDIVVNEEGRLRNFLHNDIATGLSGREYIVGNAIIVPVGLID